jgi:hypothetical protein
MIVYIIHLHMFVYKPVFAYARLNRGQKNARLISKSNKSYVRAIKEWLSCLLGSVRIVNREFDHKSISDDETVVSITSYHF